MNKHIERIIAHKNQLLVAALVLVAFVVGLILPSPCFRMDKPADPADRFLGWMRSFS